MAQNRSIFQHLALDFVTVTEQAAIAAAKWIGKGDAKAADQDAVDAMRKAFNDVEFNGEIVIGEGEKDESAELYIGEKLGTGKGPVLDIAVDPLECTDSVAYGRTNSIAVAAFAPQGNLYRAVDSYMDKISVGPLAKDAIEYGASTAENIQRVAKALGKKVGEITVAVIDRPRSEQLIKEIRAAGARIQLYTDGDIALTYAACQRESTVDMLMGIGGSAEGVLTAALLKCLGGAMYAKWAPKDEKHVARLNKAGITDFSKVFTIDDLAKGDDVGFVATGILNGPLAQGVNFVGDHIHTETIVLCSKPTTIRHIKTKHIQNK